MKYRQIYKVVIPQFHMKKVWAWIVLVLLAIISLSWITNVLGFLINRSEEPMFNSGYLIGIIGIGCLLFFGIRKMILILKKKN